MVRSAHPTWLNGISMEFSLSIQTGIQTINYIDERNNNNFSIPKYYFNFYNRESLYKLCKNYYCNFENLLYSTEYRDDFSFAMGIAREILKLRITTVIEPDEYYRYMDRSDIKEELLNEYFLDIIRFKGKDPFDGLEKLQNTSDLYTIEDQRSNIQKIRHMGISKIEESFINFMKDSEIIVLKNSPPELKSIKELLKRGAGVIIGTYVGISIGDGNPLLLLISVPAGIIIGGAAVGLSRGLEIGLEKRIVGFFQNKKHKN
jgi:hypothetical protein